MLNKTNILVIFILFTIGCVNLPETTTENVEESPTATIDIDATVMAMFEASNSKETVKKDPPADTQVNITSANTEQAVSVNTEATIEALRKELLGEIAVTPVAVAQAIPTPVDDDEPVYLMFTAPTPAPTPTPTPTPTPLPLTVEVTKWGFWDYQDTISREKFLYSFPNCYAIDITNVNDVAVDVLGYTEGFDNDGVIYKTKTYSFSISVQHLLPGQKFHEKHCWRMTEPVTRLEFTLESVKESKQLGSDFKIGEWQEVGSGGNLASQIKATLLTPNPSVPWDRRGVIFHSWQVANISDQPLLVKACVAVLWRESHMYNYSNINEDQKPIMQDNAARLSPNTLYNTSCDTERIGPKTSQTVEPRYGGSTDYSFSNMYAQILGIWVAKAD